MVMNELNYKEKLACKEVELFICGLFKDILPLQTKSDVK